jgi:hypothetical protein
MRQRAANAPLRAHHVTRKEHDELLHLRPLRHQRLARREAQLVHFRVDLQAAAAGCRVRRRRMWQRCARAH